MKSVSPYLEWPKSLWKKIVWPYLEWPKKLWQKSDLLLAKQVAAVMLMIMVGASPRLRTSVGHLVMSTGQLVVSCKAHEYLSPWWRSIPEVALGWWPAWLSLEAAWGSVFAAASTAAASVPAGWLASAETAQRGLVAVFVPLPTPLVSAWAGLPPSVQEFLISTCSPALLLLEAYPACVGGALLAVTALFSWYFRNLPWYCRNLPLSLLRAACAAAWRKCKPSPPSASGNHRQAPTPTPHRPSIPEPL